MNIAILGVRGIPAKYGGSDTLAEELSQRLVQLNQNQVIVYCRSNYYQDKPTFLNGVNLIYFKVPRLKAIESLFHSFISSIHVLGKNIDIVYFVDPANAPFCALLRLFGKKVVIHTDGLGWKRKKWGPLAQRYYKFCEWISTKAANILITDNVAIQKYYQTEYNVNSIYIPYGAENNYGKDSTILQKLQIFPKKYLLVVARLEPENNVDLIISEYSKTKIDLPLIIVGDASYNQNYLLELKKLADERVRFIGSIYDQGKLNALYEGAYLYLHGHEVGGTNPSLLRAMNAGATPVVINVPFNTTVINGSGFIFEKEKGHLSYLLEHLCENPMAVKDTGQKSMLHAQSNYSWDTVAKTHLEVFQSFCNHT
jgi:glycosyltransferase involved in cell wall biosynthesis